MNVNGGGQRVERTLSVREAEGTVWDAIVVGAGPAGGAAAVALARSEVSVLVVDRCSFPRWKVCGCCLNARAEHVLKEIGLAKVLAEGGAVPLHAVDLAMGRSRARLPLGGGWTISRERLDAGVLSGTIEHGAAFLDGTSVVAIETECAKRRVRARVDGIEVVLRARMVMLGDGLAAALAPELGGAREEASRIGLGASILAGECQGLAAPGDISMTVGRHGYVGAVVLEDGRVNLAAAIEPGFVRACGSPGDAVAAVLRASDRPVPIGLATARWKGTPGLTWTRERVEASGVVALGDSAGYVEPFTGEGMAWALEGGNAAGAIASRLLQGRAKRGEWQRWFESNLRARHRRCAAVAQGLRMGMLAELAVGVLGRSSWMSGAVSRAFTGTAA